MEPDQSKKREGDATDDTQPATDQGSENAVNEADRQSIEDSGAGMSGTPQNAEPSVSPATNDALNFGQEGPGEPFVPLSDITDPSNPVSLDALDDLAAQSSDLLSRDDSAPVLSEAAIQQLAQEIVRQMAAQQGASDATSPPSLSGVLLRPKLEAQQPEPASQPQADKSRRHDMPSKDVLSSTREENLTPAPRIVVLVQLADARALMEADRHETSREMALMLEELADARIMNAEWIKEAERRAADYRLRGPY